MIALTLELFLFLFLRSFVAVFGFLAWPVCTAVPSLQIVLRMRVRLRFSGAIDRCYCRGRVVGGRRTDLDRAPPLPRR